MSDDALRVDPEQHSLYVLAFACRWEQMKLCAAQTASAAGEECINGVTAASRDRNRHDTLRSCPAALSFPSFEYKR